MQIRITYRGTLNNVRGLWCGFKPEGAIISEERPVLIPSEGMVLHKIGTEEYSFGVWLKDSTIDDWEEITQEEYEEIVKKQEKENGDI